MNEKNELEQNSTSSESQVPDIRIPAIRTLKDDVSQTVKKDRITTAKILMAEQNKKRIEEKDQSQKAIQNTGNLFAVLFGIVFLVVAVGLIGYFGYSKITTQTPQVVNTQSNSFLFIFEQEKFIDSVEAKEKLDSLLSQYAIEVIQSPSETYTEIVFFKKDEEAKTQSRITSAEFFKLFQIPLKTNIIRSLSSDFVYGFYNFEGRAEPFFVVGVVDYENAYGNMFVWESTLALDIKPIFPVLKDLFDISKITAVTTPDSIPEEISEENITVEPRPITEIKTQTTEEKVPAQTIAVTPTTTTESVTPIQETVTVTETVTVESINRRVQFTDLVISNYNTRAIRNENGSPFFYYAFIGKDKLLFAQNPKLISEIIKKMKQKQLVR